jgi:hypothetical protein
LMFGLVAVCADAPLLHARASHTIGASASSLLIG